MATALQGLASNTPAPTPTPTAPPRNTDGTFAPVADGDFVTGADFRREASSYFQNTVQPRLNALTEMAYQTALETVRREQPDIFAKYGPTIFTNLASVADKGTLTVDNIRRLVKYSLADHLDEIAGERAQRLAAGRFETLRSNGAAPQTVASQSPDLTLASEKLPADWKKRAAEVGLDERAIDEHCASTGITRAQFFALFEKPGIITEVSIKGMSTE